MVNLLYSWQIIAFPVTIVILWLQLIANVIVVNFIWPTNSDREGGKRKIVKGLDNLNRFFNLKQFQLTRIETEIDCGQIEVLSQGGRQLKEIP